MFSKSFCFPPWSTREAVFRKHGGWTFARDPPSSVHPSPWPRREMECSSPTSPQASLEKMIGFCSFVLHDDSFSSKCCQSKSVPPPFPLHFQERESVRRQGSFYSRPGIVLNSFAAHATREEKTNVLLRKIAAADRIFSYPSTTFSWQIEDECSQHNATVHRISYIVY